RDFDIVTLDRVKRMDITADLTVWKEYARAAGIHSAILSYLELRPDYFYRIEADVDGTQFVTARGWEDLSTLIRVYEAEGLTVDEDVIHQYLQHGKIAKDFSAYLDLWHKYQDDYGVEDILQGKISSLAFQRLLKAAFDERLSLVSLLNSGLNARFKAAQFEDSLTDELYQALRHFKMGLSQTEMAPTNLLGSQIDEMEEDFEQRRAAGLTDRHALELHKACTAILRSYQKELAGEPLLVGDGSFELVQEEFAKQVDKRETISEEASAALEHAFDFMEKAFDEGQEMLVFITELAMGPYSNAFITENGCERYYKYNKNLLLDSRRAELNRQISANITRDTERGLSALPLGML
ncbi:MAG: ATPase, partial [Oscillospiraceae bacterium]|nr:ATPase [Oscillospiraceae bacterium]